MSSIEKEVKSLYEKYPYPSRKKHSLSDVSAYAKWLVRLTGKREPGFFNGKRVLEVGCGTGELACGLALNGAIVKAIDLSSASIERANALKQTLQLENVSFERKSVFELELGTTTSGANPLGPKQTMNAYAGPTMGTAVSSQAFVAQSGSTGVDAFPSPELGTTTEFAGSFDVVISMGVLHHTVDPKRAFAVCARAVKPGGFVLVGLYSSFGRWRHRLKRVLLKLVAGNNVEKRMQWAQTLFLHGRPPKKGLAWLADKYGQLHESYHSIEEVERWCKENNVVPVAWDPPLSKPPLALQFDWALSKKNAFFCVGAQKPSNTRL